MTRKRRNPGTLIDDDYEPVAHRTRSRVAAARRNTANQMRAAVDSPTPQFPAPTQLQQVALAQGGVSEATGSSTIKLARGVGIYETDQDQGTKKIEKTTDVKIMIGMTPQTTCELVVLCELMSDGMEFGAEVAYVAFQHEYKAAPRFTSIRYSAGKKLYGPSAILGTAICLAAAYEDLEVPTDLIITGMLDEAGNVQKISGTLLKARHSIDHKCRLMLPVDNLRDLPKKMKERMILFPVSTLREAIDIIKGLNHPSK